MGRLKDRWKDGNLPCNGNPAGNQITKKLQNENTFFKTVTKEEHESLRIPIYKEVYKDLCIP
jgi:hypothetical protein